MPLVRISLMRGKPAGFAQKIVPIVNRKLAERPHHDLGVGLEDVCANSVEGKKENWSFGGDIAPYAE
jgi:hypothetical protein